MTMLVRIQSACAVLAAVLIWAQVAVVRTCGAEIPPARGDPVPVEQERLMAALLALPTARAALGDAEHVTGLRSTEAWIEASLRELGYMPTLEEIRWTIPARDWPGQKSDDPPPVWHNVIVEIPGRTLPNEVLIVGAHFDAVPKAAGADDNGTGTAALLELSRVLKDEPMRRTVRFVFFNLEEVGLVGARQHAENVRKRKVGTPNANRDGDKAGAKDGPPDRSADQAGPMGVGPRVVGMVSLEMLGYFSDAPDSQKSPIKAIEGVFVPPTVGDFISVVTIAAHQKFSGAFAAGISAGAEGLRVLKVDFSPVPSPDMLRSDHAPFLAIGVAGIMVTDTANFRNPNYHKPSDTVETIDAARFTRVVRGLVNAVIDVAGREEGSK